MDYYFGYEFPAGIWEHLAVTSDGNQTKLFINGELSGTIYAAIDCPTDLIGLDNQLGAINSRLDNLRFWNVALSPILINTYQDSLSLGTHPYINNLVGYFPFNTPGDTILNYMDPSQIAILSLIHI